MSDRHDPFFIGWARPPAGLRGFLAIVAAAALVTFGAVAYVVAATAADPGAGSFRWDWGAQTVTGVVIEKPYPTLVVTRSESGRYPPGHVLLLSGPGKVGVMDRAAGLDGGLVTARGFPLNRGSIDMLQVDGAPDAFLAADGSAELPAREPLGRWRVTGEICDGKCYAGAMRPGTGIAHKACANFCIMGGVPPVFVATGPVDGTRFLLMGEDDGGDGRPVTRAVLDHTGILVEAEGRIERRGPVRVFLVDPSTIRRAP